jgi:hypothetical protein
MEPRQSIFRSKAVSGPELRSVASRIEFGRVADLKGSGFSPEFLKLL